MATVRSRVERYLTRARALGWRGALQIEGATMRRLVKSTLAATLAWEVCTLLNLQRPVLACLGAILVVQVTVRASFSRSVQLTVAVTIGLGAALLLGHVLGLHWWSIALIVLGGLIVGELLRLGPFSPQAAISGLLAISLGSAYGYDRLVDTAIGALIGVLVNALIAPPTYVQEASQVLHGVGTDLGDLLGDIGTGIAGQPDRSTVRRWLERGRDVSEDLRTAQDTVARGEESLRFNRRARTELDRLERVGEARVALDHAATQTRGIIRSLLDLADHTASPDLAGVFGPLGDLLVVAGRLVTAFGELQEHPDSAIDRERAVEAHAEALAARDRATQAMRTLPTHLDEQERLLAAIMVDAERLLHEVDAEHGAHLNAVSS
jgi:uncharacterized membrane protein YccC